MKAGSLSMDISPMLTTIMLMSSDLCSTYARQSDLWVSISGPTPPSPPADGGKRSSMTKLHNRRFFCFACLQPISLPHTSTTLSFRRSKPGCDPLMRLWSPSFCVPARGGGSWETTRPYLSETAVLSRYRNGGPEMMDMTRSFPKSSREYGTFGQQRKRTAYRGYCSLAGTLFQSCLRPPGIIKFLRETLSGP